MTILTDREVGSMTPEEIRNELDAEIQKETVVSKSGKTYALVDGELKQIDNDEEE